MQKVVIFDVDGVIVDSIKLICEFRKANRPGITDEYIKELNTRNIHDGQAELERLFPAVAKTKEQKEQMRSDIGEKKSHLPIVAGVKNLLGDLRAKGYVLAINSSAYMASTMPVLQKSGIDSLFDFIGTAEIAKKKTEKFQMIKKQYGVSLASMLFVTDSLGDLREAAEAGVVTIAVTWGIHDRSYFARYTGNSLISVVDTVDELSLCIEGYFARAQ